MEVEGGMIFCVEIDDDKGVVAGCGSCNWGCWKAGFGSLGTEEKSCGDSVAFLAASSSAGGRLDFGVVESFNSGVTVDLTSPDNKGGSLFRTVFATKDGDLLTPLGLCDETGSGVVFCRT
ncbi:unnamed protein product [Ambrosiozyma monospora]|uniref:Unnamed protein product n=1 Tax=Ambrosiozyma monospora TaxID=43982 RepID=A0ACB5U6H7_AMBMO|nr:unnamed protein product [Ambrosiozyma monospora]